MTTDTTSNQTKNGRNLPVILGLVAVILIALAVLFVTQQGNGSAVEGIEGSAEISTTFPTGSGPLAVGDEPWAFTLTDVDGNEVSLDSLAGRPVVINFWASWCGPCRIEFPHLQEAANQHGDDVVFLALNQAEDQETVVDYFRELGLTMPALMDFHSDVANGYAVGRTLPTTFFIHPEGTISAIHRGPMTFGQIEGYLADTIQ